MNSKIACLIYYASGSIVFRSNIGQILNEMRENEKLSATQLKDLSIMRLHRIVKYAYEHVPYYRQALDKASLECNSLSFPADLGKLPVLTKEIMRDYAHLLESHEGNSYYTTAKTSGSTGLPLKFKKDNQSLYYSQCAMYRGHGWYGLNVGDREAMLWGIPVSTKNRLAIKAKDFFLNRFREREYNISDEVLSDFYRKCLKRKPAYLMGYSSMVYQFACFLKNNQIDGKKIGLQMVKCTSETIHPHQRKLIEAVFDCKLVSEYGAAETGLIAFQCPYGNNHVMSDCCYVEIVTQGKHVGEGEVGKVLITEFHNFVNPVIRYDIGDLATYSSKQCPCGRPFPVIENITGRSSSVVISTSGHPFHSIIFYYIVKDYTDRDGGIKEFKVRQVSKNLLVFSIVKSERIKELDTTRLTREIKKRLGEDMRVEYVFPDSIQREESGKLKDFETNLNTDELLRLLY